MLNSWIDLVKMTSVSNPQSDDDEYEETYVMVELSGIVDTDYFSRTENPRCRIWGLDSEQPILQIDRYFFVGDYEDVIGTSLLFDEVDDSAKDGAVNESDDRTISSRSKDVFTSEAYRKSADIFNMTTTHLGHEGTPTNHAKKLKLFGHTFKKLSMHRAFLNKKQAATAGSLDPTQDADGPDDVQARIMTDDENEAAT